jgi:phosphatidylinositol glycan class A protein
MLSAVLVAKSSTSKENTVLRASLDPLMVSVIPNAVVAENFRPRNYPDASGHGDDRSPQRLGPRDPITIVVISRLFYNKGTDLLTAAIPRILEEHPNTRFLIAGSGPKAIDLEQMIEQNVLQDRVEMLGPIRHEDVRDVMTRGHIPDRGIRHRHCRGRQLWSLRRLHPSWRHSRGPPLAHDHVR